MLVIIVISLSPRRTSALKSIIGENKCDTIVGIIGAESKGWACHNVDFCHLLIVPFSSNVNLAIRWGDHVILNCWKQFCWMGVNFNHTVYE